LSARRGQTDLCGILLVDKPAGMTSHDVVDRVRRTTGERRVGHAGTLDPMATGLLVVLVGPATRLAPFLTAAGKTYEARVVFGFETDTDDAEGVMTTSARVPDEVADPFFAAGTLASLVGVHEQMPPAFSAIKKGGRVAHEAARAGETLELEPRAVEVTASRLAGIACEGELAWDIEVTVSKGTYIRALARDLGRAMNTAAHLGSLRRTRSGGIDVARASTLEQIQDAENPVALFCDPVTTLGFPVFEVADDVARRVRHGAALDCVAFDSGANGADQFAPGSNLSVVHNGVLLGVYAREGALLKPRAIIPGGAGGSR